MASSALPLDPAAALSLAFEVGDGLAADWQLLLVSGGRRTRRWEGSTDDRLPDVVELGPGALQDGEELAWTVLLYGPAQAHPYHVRVRATQGGRDLLDPPVREAGELKPRKALTLTGTLTVKVRG